MRLRALLAFILVAACAPGCGSNCDVAKSAVLQYAASSESGGVTGNIVLSIDAAGRVEYQSCQLSKCNTCCFPADAAASALVSTSDSAGLASKAPIGTPDCQTSSSLQITVGSGSAVFLCAQVDRERTDPDVGAAFSMVADGLASLLGQYAMRCN